MINIWPGLTPRTVVQTPGFFLQGHGAGLPPDESLALVKTVERLSPKRTARGCSHTSRDMRDTHSGTELLQKDWP